MTFPFECGGETAELTIEESDGEVYVTMLKSTGPGALRKVWRFVQQIDVPINFAFNEEFSKVKPHLERHGARKVMEVWSIGRI